MSERISYTVAGEVQGVNYRSWTCQQAKSLGVTGFVRNASNGTVEGEAQGDGSSLKEFVSHLHKGPSLASVDDVKQQSIDVKQGESGFSAKS